jgi:hypothetical protein
MEPDAAGAAAPAGALRPAAGWLRRPPTERRRYLDTERPAIRSAASAATAEGTPQPDSLHVGEAMMLFAVRIYGILLGYERSANGDRSPSSLDGRLPIIEGNPSRLSTVHRWRLGVGKHQSHPSWSLRPVRWSGPRAPAPWRAAGVCRVPQDAPAGLRLLSPGCFNRYDCRSNERQGMATAPHAGGLARRGISPSRR